MMTVVTEKSMSYKRGRSQQPGTWRGRAWGGGMTKRIMKKSYGEGLGRTEGK